MPVQQNGTVTPGHAAVWVTDGIIQDGGPVPASQKVLGKVVGADFNDTGDQPILLDPAVTAFQLTGIIVTNASVSLSAAVGGFYTAVIKGGSQIVANSQAYSALTDEDLLMNATLTAFANTARFSSNILGLTLGPNNQYALTVYLSLTTAQGAAATADIYLLGIDLTP